MDWIRVLQRIDAGENEQTELGRYRSFSEKDWRKAACAFANTSGGVIVLGVSDDGQIDGVPMPPDEVQERLTDLLQTGWSAPLRARLGRHQDPRGWVHWVEVDRTRGPEPMRFDGRVWVRRGRANAEPGPSELQELYNSFGFVLTEEQTVPGTGPGDIDPEAFREMMRRRGVDLEDAEPLPWETDLRNREVIAEDVDGELRATLYGLLCFGKDPQRPRATRHCAIDLVAYAGTDRGDPVLAAGEARGRLDEQVAGAERWLRSLGRQERYAGIHREDIWAVPLDAFREGVVNAVAHRDYAIRGSKVLCEVFDDRVVIMSPGSLPNHKRLEAVRAGGTPRSRNESMADHLLACRLSERRGSGYPRMRKTMLAFNGTEPTLEEDREERWLRLTLWRNART
ncbi:MAG: hypothetical protein RL071_2168 [Pseudomonadota bacterium]|jgi:predicted HTH transcriptional regulator